MQETPDAKVLPAAAGTGTPVFDAIERPLRTRGVRRSRRVPFLRFGLYYALLIAIVALLVTYVPEVRRALVTPIAVPGLEGGISQSAAARLDAATRATELRDVVDRSITTMFVMVGTLLLALPVAWSYMFTRRLRYDPALVQSILILPLVIAGIVMIVKNSLALAFSLAGIVAAVRFRNTLKDPRDAVFIFLVIGLGLATGVQAMDVGLVFSLAFNLLVLTLWKTNVDETYGAAGIGAAILAVGDPTTFLAADAASRDTVRSRLAAPAKELEADGILLVHASDPEGATRGLELTLTDFAEKWRLVSAETLPHAPDVITLVVLVSFAKKHTPVALLGELEDRWSPAVLAAEYIPVQAQAE